MEAIIDCSGIETPRQLQDRLKQALSLPDWYGSNLDALYDCLTAITQETHLVLTGFQDLPPFANGFHRVFRDAAEKNPNLNIHFL